MAAEGDSASVTSLAAGIAQALREAGVRRMFGIPGGGSSLELIEAARARDIDFILTRTETAALIMAAVTGELSETPGVALTGIGPGAASAVNGVAYAHLEKAPLILFTDGPASSLHQAFDQNALYAPITKRRGRLTPRLGLTHLAQGIEAALALPRGAVQFDMTAADARAPAASAAAADEREGNEAAPAPAPGGMARMRDLLARARHPVIIAGLEARYGRAPDALRLLAEALHCPVLLTYKAKGTLPDDHALTAGLFTGAAAESDLLGRADLIIAYGLDPVEMIPGQWTYEAPLAELTPRPSGSHLPAEPACTLCGPLDHLAAALRPGLAPSAWSAAAITRHARTIRTRSQLRGTGHTAQTVTQALSTLAPADARLAVDAGAHMFSALCFWKARFPLGVLKSNGLSTMGYALPAALASALHEPDRKALAISGDGGMMMCLGELRTAAQHGCDITLVVINDAALSLIDIKQQRSQYASRGVRYPHADFAALAAALGCASWRVREGDRLEPALAKAIAHRGPAVVEVLCDAAGYGDQLVALRG